MIKLFYFYYSAMKILIFSLKAYAAFVAQDIKRFYLILNKRDKKNEKKFNVIINLSRFFGGG